MVIGCLYQDIMANAEEPFKKGYLFTQPKSYFKRQWSKRYYALYRPSLCGRQRLEVFATEHDYIKQALGTAQCSTARRRHSDSSQLIALNDCIKVTPLQHREQPNVFQVCTKDRDILFSVEMKQELAGWIEAFQTVAFSQQSTSPALSVPRWSPCTTPADTSVDVQQQINSPFAHAPWAERAVSVEEHNDIYSSIDPTDYYTVRPMSSEGVTNCNLNIETFYRMAVTPTQLILSEPIKEQGSISPRLNLAVTYRQLYTWPFLYLRRFGRDIDSASISFESGRRCQSGAAFFKFYTKSYEQIYMAMHNHLGRIKQSQESLSRTPETPTAELDWEERRRSVESLTRIKPLSSATDFDRLSTACQSLRINPTAKVKITNASKTVSEIPLSKSRPAIEKPPRKSLPKPDLSCQSNVPPPKRSPLPPVRCLSQPAPENVSTLVIPRRKPSGDGYNVLSEFDDHALQFTNDDDLCVDNNPGNEYAKFGEVSPAGGQRPNIDEYNILTPFVALQI